MERFPRGYDDQWTLIKRVMEYEYAVSRGKPVMGVLRESPRNISSDMIDHDVAQRASLEQFRELVKHQPQ